MDGKSIVDHLFENARTRPLDAIIKHKKNNGGAYADVSWKELKDTSLLFAGGLSAIGMKRGDRMALVSANRYEWIIADLACIIMGGADVPVYQTNTADQCAYIINDSGSKFAVAEDEKQLDKILSKEKSLKNLKKIILINGARRKNKKVLMYSDVLELGKKAPGKKKLETIEKAASTIDPESMMTIVYTSGTTGPPKGCMVSHRNTSYVLKSIDELIKLDPATNLSLMVLPLSHFYPRISGYYYNIFKGIPFAIAESIDTLARNMVESRPTYFTSVPRIFEKVHNRIIGGLEEASPVKRLIFSGAVKAGRMRSRTINSGKRVPFFLSLAFMAADILVFKKVRDKLGGRLQFAVSAGAPLSASVGEFIHSIGIRVIEFYGLTETLGGTMTTFDKCRYGTVGTAMPGFEVKIADDGEILIRGNNFMGYWKKPKLTKKILRNSWCYTGDIGYWDEGGFLVINDRKKDLIVTSGGKKISPQNIENMLKKIPLVSNAMVYGDRKNYCTALLTLERADVEAYAERNGIPFGDYTELVRSPEITGMIQKELDRINAGLAKFESIKKATILPNEFSMEEGEVTPTLKIKRKNITARYKKEIEAMYGAGD